MDSKVVNKLIRSEVWPLLRQHGFTKFSARTAWRYRAPFVDVVNFQSFNSYLAEGIGCTTYSFTLNIAVYVQGSAIEDRVKLDSAGRLMPQECECAFRLQLEKSEPIDRFERRDVFLIDPDGRSAAAVFREVQRLLGGDALKWFDAVGNLDAALAWLAEQEPIPNLPVGLDPGFIGGFGSYAAHDLEVRLRILKHELAPTKASAHALLGAIEKTLGSMQDISSSLDLPEAVDVRTLQAARLIRRLGDWAPRLEQGATVLGENIRLEGRTWAGEKATDEAVPASHTQVSPRREFWPTLKQGGFTEFTDRLAHRSEPGNVHVVWFAPIQRDEARRRALPPGLFRVGIGVFWPLLAERKSYRKNRAGQPRPALGDCHLRMWLQPDEPAHPEAPTAFASADQAVGALQTDGLAWLAVCQSEEKLVKLLNRATWEILYAYPTLRGHGSADSIPRQLLLAALAHHRGQAETLQDHLRSAASRVECYQEHLQPRYEGWLKRVEARLTNPEHPS